MAAKQYGSTDNYQVDWTPDGWLIVNDGEWAASDQVTLAYEITTSSGSGSTSVTGTGSIVVAGTSDRSGALSVSGSADAATLGASDREEATTVSTTGAVAISGVSSRSEDLIVSSVSAVTAQGSSAREGQLVVSSIGTLSVVGVGTAIRRIGDILSYTVDTANSDSRTITVPEGATLAVVSYGHYSSGAAVTAISIDGNALTDAISYTGVQYTSNGCGHWYLVNPTIGDVNLSLTKTNTTSMVYYVHFYSGVDLTSPIRDTGVASNGSGSPVTIETSAMGVVAGDLCISHLSSYTSVDTAPSGSGQTILVEETTRVGGTYNGMAEKLLTSDGTTTMLGTGSYVMLIAIVLAIPTSSGEGSTEVIAIASIAVQGLPERASDILNSGSSSISAIGTSSRSTSILVDGGSSVDGTGVPERLSSLSVEGSTLALAEGAGLRSTEAAIASVADILVSGASIRSFSCVVQAIPIIAIVGTGERFVVVAVTATGEVIVIPADELDLYHTIPLLGSFIITRGLDGSFTVVRNLRGSV